MNREAVELQYRGPALEMRLQKQQQELSRVASEAEEAWAAKTDSSGDPEEVPEWAGEAAEAASEGPVAEEAASEEAAAEGAVAEEGWEAHS